jgi:hypothetical protein
VAKSKSNKRFPVVFRKISELKPAPYNPQEISAKQFEELKRSLSRFDAVEPAVINTHPKRKDIVIGGHKRLKAARDLKWSHYPCYSVKLPLNKERELNIRLNKNRGQFSNELLKDNFKINELQDWGFEDIDFMKDSDLKLDAKDDIIPEKPRKPKTKTGDLYKLGAHRLLCGDCTKSKDLNRLVGKNKIGMVLTDPPYGMGYEYNLHKDVKGKEYLEFCDAWFSKIKDI